MKKIIKSLKFKIMIAVVGILFISILAETVIWVENTIGQTRQTIVSSVSSSLSVANQNFETAMKDIERICALAGTNVGEATCVRNYLRVMSLDSSSTIQEKVQAGREVKQFLLGLCRFQFYLTGVAINDLNGHQQTYGIIMGDTELQKQEWLQEFLDSSADTEIIAPHENSPNGNINSEMVFSVIRKIPNNSETQGIILADISYDMLEDFYYLEDLSEYPIYITAGSDPEKVIYPRENAELLSEKQMSEIKMEVPITGWTLYGKIPEKNIVSSSMDVLKMIFIMSTLLCIVLCTAIGAAITYMTRDLSTLAEAVKQVSGEHLELPVKIKSEDEVGELYQQINVMLKRIRGLIIEIQDSEQAKRELEILTLQEQINPHFLYNTLNIITYLSQLRGAKNIEYVSSSLSDMLHLALGAEKYITVGEEIDYLRQYLKIMEYKYSGKFIPEFLVDSNTNNCVIPKLILQPLVENSLKHGIATLLRPGYIRISAAIKDGRLLLSVWDNGNGISEELLSEINRVPMKKEVKSEFSIGVYNVRNRIYLLYGSQGRFQMSSKLNQYTLAEIEIPVNMRENLL